MLVTTKHSPRGDGSAHLDNGRLEQVIARFQLQGDTNALGEIISLTEKRALKLIRFHKTARHAAEDELLSDIHFKLLRAVEKFNPAKGTAFTFVSQVVMNTLCTSVTNARRSSNRFVEFDESIANNLRTNGETESRDAIDDLAHRIRVGVKTTMTDQSEVAMQRWYVDSFINGAFELRRHQCADAAMAVYSLSHERSSELYDLTMLEVRRVLYDDVKRRQPISPGQLYGTRSAWLARYSPLLTRDWPRSTIALFSASMPFWPARERWFFGILFGCAFRFEGGNFFDAPRV
jgi:hypothetical protein